jgi:hypothetical protein
VRIRATSRRWFLPVGALLAFAWPAQASDDVAGERWLYALGAVPTDCVGFFHVGSTFALSVSSAGSDWRLLIGLEADYSHGRGTKWKSTENFKEITVTANDAPFSFLSTGFLLGARHVPSGVSATFDVGNVFWQTKLENWGYPTYLGFAIRWQARKRIAVRIVDLRWYFRDLGAGSTVTCIGTCTQSGLGTDSTGLGTRLAAGIEARW